MMKTNEEYDNLIELLKQALKFYANDDNYTSFNPKIDPTMIALDSGTQAKFALEKIKTFQDDRDEREKKFVKNMISAIESDANQDTVLGLIEAYKNETE